MSIQDGVIKFSVVDGTSKRSSEVKFYWASDDVLTLENIKTMANYLWALLKPLTRGGQPRFVLHMELPFDEFEPTREFAQAAADNEEMCRFKWVATGPYGDFPFNQTIPTFQENKFLWEDYYLNTSDPDVAAFITLIVGGLSLGRHFTDSRGAVITSFNEGQEWWGPGK